jgi:hypothetical protein
LDNDRRDEKRDRGDDAQRCHAGKDQMRAADAAVAPDV